MKDLKIVGTILIAIILLFVITKTFYKGSPVKPVVDTADEAALLEIRSNDWVMGTSTAQATLVEYLDFECEACGAYYPMVTQLKEEYGDQLSLVVRYFPLPGHRNSKTAAYAVEAAGKQGKFWEMYNILFTKQAEWSEQQVPKQSMFEKYAVEAGVDITKWREDVKNQDIQKRVDDSYDESVSLGLQGTPSFFLNGKKIENPKGYDNFKALIDAEIK